MKLYSLIILNYNTDIVYQSYDLSSFSFFKRNTIKEFIIFFAKTIAKRTNINEKTSVEEEQYFIHLYKTNNLTAIVVCDNEYPERSAFNIIHKMLVETNSDDDNTSNEDTNSIGEQK